MREAELLLLGLMVAVVGLSVLARAVRVPYPILPVLGGLVLGFVPGMPEVELPPELVLVVFLRRCCTGPASSPRRGSCAPTCARSRCWRSGWSWRPWARSR
jgi:hypothetical protein